jgi:ElaB/YqjD/DUF883 family membrane-anchored ribosome-binding protein
MEQTQTSNENFVAALKLLEEAAKQKKDELKAVMSDKYTNLRSLILEKESSLMKSLTSAKDQAVEMRDAGIEKTREIAHDVDENVHQNPWPYIAGSAVVGVLLGYIMGRNRS